jgi:hypothetical protein
MRIKLFAAAASLLLAPASLSAQAPDAFTGSFRMELHSYKKGKEEKHSPANMRLWSKPDMLLFEAESTDQPQRMRMLVDQRGKWSYTLMDNGQGSRTAMKMRLPELNDADKGEQADPPRITVTKETKVIEGRTCTKVIAESKEGTWTGWVASGTANAFAAMARGLAGPGAPKHDHHAATAVDGFPLEYEWVPANGDVRMACYIKDLVVGKVDERLFDLSGYQVMELPAFAMPQR